MDMNWLEFGIETMAPLIEVLIVLAATVIADLIRREVRDKRKGEQAAMFLGRLNDAALDAVLTTEQTFVRELKANAADGKLDRKDMVGALDRALYVLKGYLGPKGVATARDVLGRNGDALDTQLKRLLEAKIAELKQ